jgi:hypothetical protein
MNFPRFRGFGKMFSPLDSVTWLISADFFPQWEKVFTLRRRLRLWVAFGHGQIPPVKSSLCEKNCTGEKDGTMLAV